MKKQIIINVESTSETECLVAILSLGLCMALENKALTRWEAENYLFSPYTMRILKEAGASSDLVEAIHIGTELEDYEEHLPHKLPDRLNRMKSTALKVLRSLPQSPLVWPRTDPKWPKPKEKWLQVHAKDE